MGSYPNYFCEQGVGEAVDEHGNLVSFANPDMPEVLIGFVKDVASGIFVESKELTADPVCFIPGTSCYATEAHLDCSKSDQDLVHVL
jgi:hypothetical protein